MKQAASERPDRHRRGSAPAIVDDLNDPVLDPD
jgi:hypothetical protein